MPEGPEVRRYADALDAALAGRRLTALGARTREAKAWLAAHPDAFPGRSVRRVWAHGKHLVGEVEGALFFASHLLMWGRWHVVPVDDPAVAAPDRRERARVLTAETAALLYSAPVFHVGRGSPYAHVPWLAGLGPDALPYGGPGAFDREAFHARLFGGAHGDRAIGAALLDQTVVAGLGNYLRAEILFACRLDPWRRVDELTPDELRCLDREIPRVTRLAYETAGRTVSAAEQARMLADPALTYNGKPWNARHHVFRRTNLPCLICGTPIRQRRQVTRAAPEAGEDDKTRIIYFCPTCQQTEGPGRL
ncbi:MAG: DNA-formamidopyrimidine glycosylase family protein [Rubricoccaceae bacterium]